MLIKNFWGHLKTITVHRFIVFKLSCMAGIPWRGFIHDLSKYSPEEFFEGVKYYKGTISPIEECRKIKGYSLATLHHTGRNKHHFEYWYDHGCPDLFPVIPYKYVVEMVCDALAAGMTYKGKEWTKDEPLQYWEKVLSRKTHINDKIMKVFDEIYHQISENGVKLTIKGKNLKEIYNKYVYSTKFT